MRQVGPLQNSRALDRTRSRLASLACAAALAAVGGLLLAGNPSRAEAGDVVPSAGGVPGPAGASGPTSADNSKSLDEWLAYVAGETITRRMIVREIGERAEGQTEAEHERSIKQTLFHRVLTGCMVWKAKQFGLEVKPDVLDEQVAIEAKDVEEQARERGIDLPFKEILAKRGQSLDEFKELFARDVLVRNYWMILIRGVPGKKPQLDPEPSPNDCRTLYQAHRDEFNVQPGVRIGMFSARPADLLDRVADYDSAEATVKASLRALAQEAIATGDTAKVGAAHKLKKGFEWDATPKGMFTEPGFLKATNGEAVEAWVFDRARRRGDVEVFDVGRGTLRSIAILEVRPERTRTYEESLPDVMGIIRITRIQRFQMQHQLEVLSVAPVKPTAIVDILSNDLREQLHRMDADPVRRDIRLR